MKNVTNFRETEETGVDLRLHNFALYLRFYADYFSILSFCLKYVVSSRRLFKSRKLLNNNNNNK